MIGDIDALNWEKMNGLLPAIIQDVRTSSVLMLGYMNQEALMQTINTKQVTFFSRSKNRLWVKGETSGNILECVQVIPDCDGDALLVYVHPTGSVCHLGNDNCFNSEYDTSWNIIFNLEKIIVDRAHTRPENSYTSKLFDAGLQRIAQKVGEEAVEVVLASMNSNNDEMRNEAADLLFHFLVLLTAKGLSLSSIIQLLKERRCSM